MDFWAKVEHFKKDMRARGGWWGLINAVPPYLSLAWRLGIRARPPYFLPFWRSALVAGGTFAVGWGLFMLLFTMPVDAGWQYWAYAAIAVLAGGLFGVLMAGFWRWQGCALGLSSWDEYPAKVASTE